MSETIQQRLSECCNAETYPDISDPFDQRCTKCHQSNVEFQGELKVVGRICWHNWQCQHLGRTGIYL